MFFMKHTLTSLLIITVTLLVIASCDNSTTQPFVEPDLSTVPDPYDTTGVEKVSLDDDLAYYELEEGTGSFKVESRDAVALFITARLQDGTIITSTYTDGRTTPQTEQVASFATTGFRRGIIGMKADGKRVIVSPPELAYGDAQPGSINYAYRNETIIFDVLIDQILIAQ